MASFRKIKIYIDVFKWSLNEDFCLKVQIIFCDGVRVQLV